MPQALHILKSLPVCILTIGFAFTVCLAAQESDIRQYNVAWDSPSTDSVGSMPLSGGDLGLNVWVEGDDLLFYIGHPDSRIENEKLVKLGRVRMTLSPSPFKRNFRQELDLGENCIRINSENTAINLWVGAFQPVVHVKMKSSAPVTASVAFESWRFTANAIRDGLEWFYRLDPQKSDLPGKIKNNASRLLRTRFPIRSRT